jgi:RHS repeat-associated protein
VGGTTRSFGFSAARQSPRNADFGFSVFRNRLYDPRTGRWTQEDPLGVAGGVNLYQFNNNNPANYTDPFGLCPPEDENYSDCEAGSSEWYAHRIATGEGNAVVNEVGGALATCGESISCTTSLLPIGAVANGAARVGNALVTAAKAVGYTSVRVASKVEAQVAGRIWTASKGERVIHGSHGTGPVVGRISGNGQRVYRAPQVKSTGPNAGKEAANLENKATGGNTHLVIDP